MKRFAPLLLVAALFAAFASSCKKSEETVVITPIADPRDSSIGSYTVGYNISITAGSITLQPESYTGTVSVSKGSQTDRLSILFNLPSGRETLTASFSAGQGGASTYTILDKTAEPIILNGQRFDGIYTASGQFTGKNEFIFISTSLNKDLKKTTYMTGAKK